MNLDVSTKKGYDIATALRGPDVGCFALKYIITGWVREQCGVSSKHTWVRTIEVGEGNMLRAKGEVNHLYKHVPTRVGMRHWARHAALAVDHLNADHWLRELTHLLKDLTQVCTKENLDNVLGWLDNYSTKGGEAK